jgi:hypothetical protein
MFRFEEFLKIDQGKSYRPGVEFGTLVFLKHLTQVAGGKQLDKAVAYTHRGSVFKGIDVEVGP